MNDPTPTALLHSALAAFQSELPTVGKHSTANMGARGDYRYADLKDVSEAVYPLLAKNGLAFIAMPTTRDGDFVLHYKLTHTAGAFEEGHYPLPNGKPQDVGSAITYARRYALCAVTGVAPGGDDDDAQKAQKAEPSAALKRVERPVQVAKAPDGFYSRIRSADSLDGLQALYEEASKGGFSTSLKAEFTTRGEELKK
jgi:hypothetical protein